MCVCVCVCIEIRLMDTKCSICKGIVDTEDDNLIVVTNDEIDAYVCYPCEVLLKNAFVRCDCSYCCVEKSCPDGRCRYHDSHSVECGYTNCKECTYGSCGCSYNPKSGTCRGQRCRNESHNYSCEFYTCEACTSYHG